MIKTAFVLIRGEVIDLIIFTSFFYIKNNFKEATDNWFILFKNTKDAFLFKKKKKKKEKKLNISHFCLFQNKHNLALGEQIKEQLPAVRIENGGCQNEKSSAGTEIVTNSADDPWNAPELVDDSPKWSGERKMFTQALFGGRVITLILQREREREREYFS